MNNMPETISSETDETSDEVADIKNAMRICRKRQSAFQGVISDKNTDKNEDCREKEAAQHQSIALLKKKHCETIIQLEKRCMALEEELNYTKKVLKTKEKNLHEESHLVDLKVQAIDVQYKEAYGKMKKVLSTNNKAIKAEISKLYYILSMLERNTQHGRHVTLSETNVGLLLKLRSGLENIDCASEDPDKRKARSSIDDLDGEANGKSEQENQFQSPHVDATLLDICKHLEDENGGLKRDLEHSQREQQKLREKAAKASLIPHYRAAIVKSREECSALTAAVQKSKDLSLSLQENLERKKIDAQKLEANLTKMKGLQFQLIEERDKYKAVVIDVIEDKHPTLSKAPTYAGEGRTDEEILQRKFAEQNLLSKKRKEVARPPSSHNISSCQEGVALNGREALMQENLSVLDCEIDSLRKRLEVATVSRTQSMMADVIGSSTMHVVEE